MVAMFVDSGRVSVDGVEGIPLESAGGKGGHCRVPTRGIVVVVVVEVVGWR